ncbi:MAG: hypothetical protein ACYSUF_12975 [Planctomycetota bacterium]|jgi:hypothetical protein
MGEPIWEASKWHRSSWFRARHAATTTCSTTGRSSSAATRRPTSRSWTRWSRAITKIGETTLLYTDKTISDLDTAMAFIKKRGEHGKSTLIK